MSSMAEGTFEIINALGLHARAAAQLVQVANRYKSEVSLMCEGQKANAKSIMGVLMLAAAQGMQVTVTCKGEDAEACLQEIQKLIANRFGESK
ncbi:HPr family phosphocarrier protein [Archangium violaceum]|uniref:HPr family phosphocarrier protein n=1 Tax=Archangium violaceum TaxID=83451 RepID=UPI00193B2FB1|nr:HPr family phosphocarrier protein [Archangium violaceum]QRK09774.1 HPr family phosphocarrier protein [Archangium violaceum]